MLIDLLWSDPADCQKTSVDFNFKRNMNRKCSVNYGSQAVNDFLEQNDLLCIVRAHEVKQDGY